MDYQQRTPEPPLGESVESIFHVRGYDPEHRIERVVPDGHANIVIELDDQQRAVVDNDSHKPRQFCQGAWLSSMHRAYFSITALPATELAVIRFRPGGLYPLLKRPVFEIAGKILPAEDVLGGEQLTLRAEIRQADAAADKLNTIERWLLANLDVSLQPPTNIRQAILDLQAQPTLGRLQDLAAASGYSRKQFNHLFRKHVGLSPKIFQRILRFGQILQRVQNEEQVSWAALSLDCGYTDQSHFIKDFQQFSGFNPSQFLSLETDRVNFFPMAKEGPEDVAQRGR